MVSFIHADGMEEIRIGGDGDRFVYAGSGKPFIAWGVNYDHDASGRLLEDYWVDEWDTVVEDFGEIKALGANVVRIHLQVAKFMNSPNEPNEESLKQLARLTELAEQNNLYLDITGLGCYHKQDVPEWYDALDEAERWQTQAAFWQAIAKTCKDNPAVFCYDLMNEPVLPGADKVETDWLTGELGGKYFVQRITLDLAGRAREEVAKDWVDLLVSAIRKHDEHRLVTLGVIPWALVFPKAKPFFYSPQVGENLDFVSVHFYPNKGEIEQAVTALSAYETGKPLVIEEMFPLKCSVEELDEFIEGSRRFADGWIGFYWGRTADEYKNEETIPAAITRNWLEFFQTKSPEMIKEYPLEP